MYAEGDKVLIVVDSWQKGRRIPDDRQVEGTVTRVGEDELVVVTEHGQKPNGCQTELRVTVPYSGVKPSVNRERMAEWIKALRSGDYRQGEDYLHTSGTEERFCCLGVACDLAVKEGVITARAAHPESGSGAWNYASDGEESFLPESVRSWLGLLSADPTVYLDEPLEEFGPATACVTDLNDGERWTFDQIADALERTYLR